MKKRIISLLLVFTMLFSLLPASALAAQTGSTGTQSSQSTAAQQTTAKAASFADVKETDWFYAAVQYAAANGFFSGTSATTFGPDGTMTRGMFVTVLARMAGVKAADYSAADNGFTDVSPDAYYAPFVTWAAQYGITGGTGEGTFSPNALITRQQMAVFFVKYFETMGVDYATGANITTQPGDLDQVADWAKDAVLKLWKQGLLSGDGKNFDPTGDASRAQAAALCRSTDKAVDTWYSAPGVKSERVPVDPATQPTTPAQKPEDNKGGGSSGGGGGGSKTTYYEVAFQLGSGQDGTGVTLPATQTYASGTSISQLPTPSCKTGIVFLGWYADAALTTPVSSGDTVTANRTLYAQVAAGDQVQSMETPNYTTKDNVPAGDYSFRVTGVSDIKGALKIIQGTDNNNEVTYTVSGDTVTVALEAGQTYQAQLSGDQGQYVVDGETQPESVRYLNVLTAKGEVKNANLNKNMVEGDLKLAQGLDKSVFDGLYQGDVAATQANTTSGSFTSTQEFLPGQTVYFAQNGAEVGNVESTTGDIAYIKITSVSATKDTNGYYTYGYEMADVDDVVFIPDTLPIEAEKKSEDGKFTISTDDLAKSMKEAEAKALDVGDLIVFYDGTYSENNAAGYAKIKNFKFVDGNCTIEYETIANESGVEAEMNQALDVYYDQDQEINLTEQEKAEITNGIRNQMQDSGYMEQAGLYMAAMLLAGDDVNDLPSATEISEQIAMAQQDGHPTLVMGSRKAEVSVNWSAVQVRFRRNLEHLQGTGLGVTVTVPIDIKLGDGVTVSLSATFQEEARLSQRISTSRHKIKFLKYDYSLNASFEVGNYTGVNFTANIVTGDEDESKDALGKRLEQVMDIIEGQKDSASVSGVSGVEELAEVYKDLMDSAGDSWYDVVNYKLFENNGNAFLHIFCWQVKGSFVVQVNVNASLGMNFEYINQKRYNYSVRVKAKTSTNQTIDIIPARYNFDFYVVGMVGVRAGLRLEMYVGLFSLKLDKVGLIVDVGAYVQLWGYFYYHKEWTQAATAVKSGGALLIEVGVYLDIRFLAQVFNSSKLTFSPSLYNNQWPVWSAGARQNVYDFSVTDDTNYSFKTVKTLSLPSSTFRMKAMDLKTGQIGTKEGDDATESAFQITFTNKAFRYDAENNTVTVKPENGSLSETTQMVIVYKKAPLTFSSQAITKVLSLSWSDPEGMRYLAFNSMGGSAIPGLSGGSGAPITWPADPTREGYAFQGWFTDGLCTREYTGSKTTMPTFFPGYKGQILYAKWTPVERTYTVEHYFQNLDGTYGKQTVSNKGQTVKSAEGTPETTLLTGKTGEQTRAVALTREGYQAKAFEQQTISPVDNSTVVKIYYDRKSYTLTFNSQETGDRQTLTFLYGAPIQAPGFSREGYDFTGWEPAIAADAKVEKDATYEAQWQIKTYGIVWSDNHSSLNEKYGTTHTDSIDSKTGTYGTGLEIPDNPAAPEVTGAQVEFMGWNTMPDGSGIMLDKFADNTVTGPATYYAQWTVVWNKYNLTWFVDAEEGESIPEGTYTSGQVAFGTEIVAPPTPVKKQTAECTYTFDGWCSDNDLTQKVESFGKMGAADVTYYARFTSTTNKYTVTWDFDGGTTTSENYTQGAVDYGTKIVAPDVTKAPDAEYTYEFIGWKAQDGQLMTDTVQANVTYIAQYELTKNKYTVTWDVNGGNPLTGTYTCSDGQPVDYGTEIVAPVPSRNIVGGKEYEFMGWFDKDGNPKTNTVTGNVTYYAKWAESDQVLTVTFNANGGELSGDKTQKVVYNNVIIKPSDPTRTGYTFRGWYVAGESDAMTEWSFETAILEDVTLVAQWEINVYTITWVVDGQTWDTTKCEYNVVPTHADPTKAAEGSTVYTFVEWQPKLEAATGDTTYTAFFSSSIQTKVTFDNNSSYAEGGPTEAVYATPDNPMPEITGAPSRPGYKFDGYYDAKTGGTQYYDGNGNSATNWDKTEGGSTTLYAHWTAYQVTFDWNYSGTDADSKPENKVVAVNESGIITSDMVPKHLRSQWTFAGWYMNTYGSGDAWTAGDVLTGNVTVYAKWKEPDRIYNVEVAGIRVTSDNLNDVLEDGGSVSYNWDKRMLTLSNADISYEGTVIRGFNDDVELHLVGNNKLVNTATDEENIYGIYAYSSSAWSFSGNGTLTVETQDADNAAMNVAIKSEGYMTFADDNPTIIAKAGTAKKSYGIYVNHKLLDSNTWAETWEKTAIFFRKGRDQILTAGTIEASGHTCAVYTAYIGHQSGTYFTEFEGATSYGGTMQHYQNSKAHGNLLDTLKQFKIVVTETSTVTK